MLGSEASLHIDSPARRKIDLAGTWTYSLDNETWKDVKVPGSFDYRGRVTFLRKFAIDEATLRSSSIQLVAMGINYDAEIYVNGVFVGKHVGGYTTIQFPLPENSLELGDENAITIIVTNNLSARSTLPLRKQIWGWRNYGGILRDIYLLVTPKLWIDRVFARTGVHEDLTRGNVNVAATLTNMVNDSSGDTLSSLLRSAQVL
ncbi:MAG: sugar-binding domain-containing protein, partial [Bacteroidota bacterium]